MLLGTAILVAFNAYFESDLSRGDYGSFRVSRKTIPLGLHRVRSSSPYLLVDPSVRRHKSLGHSSRDVLVLVLNKKRGAASKKQIE